MTAAAAVGTATRALQLAYALEQGGAAVLAAQTEDHLPRSHGLTIRPGATLFDTMVKPNGRGMFQAVAAATGSPGLSGGVSLGEVWASLPELADTIDEERWPVALRAGVASDDEGHDFMKVMASGLVQLELQFHPPAWTREDVTRRLARYPTAVGGTALDLPSEADRVRRAPIMALFRTVVSWSFNQDAGESFWSTLDGIAPSYRVLGERWIRPGVGAKLDQMSPLMSWWIVLYALSWLCRYRPVEWAACLDVDSSEEAAEVEFALSAGLEAVPRLLVEATAGGEPILQAP
jgi:hypothetical protein